MAGNKINTKTKSKEDKSKSNKGLNQTNDVSEDIDFSVLRKPILTSITGFAQARNIYDIATAELKGIISNECDLLYECKVCRNIFRSLANFISHKRVYCKEQFSSSLHGQFFKVASSTNELMKIKKIEEEYFVSLKEKNVQDTNDIDDLDCRVPMTKDLTTIVEKIIASKGVQNNASNDSELVLQKIPNSSVAVFQSVNKTDEKLDKMKAQVKELDNILAQNKAILQSDGKFKIQSSLPSDADNVIQISDDEDNIELGSLKCKICNQNFSTLKTLKFHMKYKHLESRLVYPCPDCFEIFSTSWSVYRHLFKLHRKTAAQIRRLRESIQAKAFRMNNPPAFYEKRKNIKPPPVQKLTEEERLDQENQAWMDNMEGEGEVPRCFGCGRSFERRAALAAHTHTCQPRCRALARRQPDAKRIEIQIRKDYHKGPAAQPNNDNQGTKSANEDLANVTKLNKDADMETDEPTKPQENANSEATQIEVAETQETSENCKEKSPPTFLKSFVKLPLAQHIEKSNLTALRQKIQPDIEVSKLMCKKCELQHDTVQELYDHMANHYKWLRYACKLCNFKHYQFEKLPEHVKIVHKLKGDSDFYFSTVKALDGNEALELAENLYESDVNDTSPDSRRPSRCSSDSSRLSDDSSSSSTRVEGSRKRKMGQAKNLAKKKKEIIINDDDGSDSKTGDTDKDICVIENDASSNSKTFEENSSDMDDIEEKVPKRHSIDISSVASRRPVRKKTKPKNEDFEYDLSNLLKMEAQGYRDSQNQSVVIKSNQSKKKLNQTDQSSYYEIVNRDCHGALVTLSKLAVEKSAAHIKNLSFLGFSSSKDTKPSSIFVRPMLPKTFSRGDKNSPKKDTFEEIKDTQSPQKDDSDKSISKEPSTENTEIKTTESELNKSETNTGTLPEEKSVTKNTTIKPSLNMSAVVPFKFRRQSLDVMKNPLINKNISDLKKAGMKTKILVIKPINRNTDGIPSKTPLKFQTIKLKDPSKSSSSKEEKSKDQVVVVKVPKVDCAIARVSPDVNTLHSNDKVQQTVQNNKNIEKDAVSSSKNINNNDDGTTYNTSAIINKDDNDAERKEETKVNESIEVEDKLIAEATD